MPTRVCPGLCFKQGVPVTSTTLAYWSASRQSPTPGSRTSRPLAAGGPEEDEEEDPTDFLADIQPIPFPNLSTAPSSGAVSLVSAAQPARNNVGTSPTNQSSLMTTMSAVEGQGPVSAAPSTGDVLPVPDDYYPPIPDRPSSPPRPERLNLDESFLKDCKLMGFDPRRLGPSNLELLFRLGQAFGPGISRAEFRRIMRWCICCGNIVFVQKVDSHACGGTVLLTTANGFDIVDAFLCLSGPNAGFTWLDLNNLLTRCDACECIIPEGTVNLHACSVLGQRYR
ncbi:hypothetical protein FA13DRAFT_1796474 [Coprinellus micaceus]|uniref:Uncharacterized protein n=1 Tax=Coprinellus micaceus TaxID=71717 RepID=A0A4Y7SUA4_COPMI|nr:hypothetical protein FA13DRAFT_1796474 [Coprinellus micaceus]